MPKFGYTNPLVFLITILILTSAMSCRKDLDFESNPNIALQFSKDTIFLDTIFTQSNSETYLLKVYNPSNDDISLSNIYLNQRENSNFRINVDGVPGFEFSEVPLRAKDSLMVFVEVAMQQTNDMMIEEDELVFSDSQQQVKLLAMIEDAIYHYPNEGEDFIQINQDTEWNNNKSHVVYGTLKVDNAALHIAAGAKLYFHTNSGMLVENGGSLNLNGTIDNPVLMRGNRHDARYDSLPKQWNEVKLKNANLNANYAIIKGGKNGFSLENSSANIENTQIYNMSSSGIFAKNANIIGKNVVIADAGDASLNIEKGGNYEFYYSTFANVWKTGLVGNNGPNVPAYLSNYTEDENGNESYAALNAFFGNCIFYGRYANGVYLDEKEDAEFNSSFDRCFIKNENTDDIDYTTHPSFINPLTGDPMFVASIFSQQDLRLQEESPAKNVGNSAFNSQAPKDIKGVLRGQNPNIGAYE